MFTTLGEKKIQNETGDTVKIKQFNLETYTANTLSFLTFIRSVEHNIFVNFSPWHKPSLSVLQRALADPVY